MEAAAAALLGNLALCPSPEQLEAMWRVAQWFEGAVKRGLQRPHGANCAEMFAVKILVGHELGLPPGTAIYSIDLSQGNVGISAKAKIGLVRKRGIAKIELVEATPDHATCRVHRMDWPADKWVMVTWTREDSERAGLLRKDNHRHYPTAMNAHRAMTQAVDLYCQDAAMGLGYTYDELGLETTEDGELADRQSADGNSPLALTSAEGEGSPDDQGATAESTAPPLDAQPTPSSSVVSDAALSSESAPTPEQVFPEAAMRQKIRELLESAKFANPAAWKRWCAKHAEGRTLPNFRPADAELAVTHLELLHSLYRLRQLVAMDDNTWQSVTLGKRGIENDLDLDPADAQGIYDKLWARATPFAREAAQQPASSDSPAPTSEGNSPSPAADVA